MAGSPLTKEASIDLLMEQVESRNKEIFLKRQAMTKAINMLSANDCTNADVINVLVEGM